MEDLYDPEEKILCPYNDSHHIRRCKMSFHLVKCKKNYGAQKMVPCDFNATHMISEPELRYHHQICPDRKKIEAQIVESQTKSENRFPIPALNCESDENWDNVNVPAYDPNSYTEKNDILRRLDVESERKRKNFRRDERLRLGGLTKPSVPVRAEPEKKAVKLPPRPKVNVDEQEFKPSVFREKLRLENEKVFLQYEPGPSNNQEPGPSNN